MRSLTLARLELRQHRRRWLPRLAIAAIVLVPLLYGALYLWAFWDPYSRVDRMPVALVNLDVSVRADGSALSAGIDLTRTLEASETFDWQTASASEAAQGLEDGSYYLALTIPQDFSARLAATGANEPSQAALQLRVDPSSNYIASSIVQRVIAEVRSAASESVSSGYYERIFVGLADARMSTRQAADGATKLSSGLGRASDGGASLTAGLTSGREGAGRLTDGLGRLVAGASALATGAGRVADGSAVLAGGINDARSGAGRLAAGGTALADGASGLSKGLASLVNGSPQLSSAAADLASGAAAVRDGVERAGSQIAGAVDAAGKLGAAATQLRASLQALAAVDPTLASDPDFVRALAAAGGLQDGLAQLSSGLSAAGADGRFLAAGATQVAQGSSSLSMGISRYLAGVSAASTGADRLAGGAGRLAGGAGRLAGGLEAAAAGADKLAGGTAEVAGGSISLRAGAGQARNGAAQLDTGLVRLASGARVLSGGLVRLARGSSALSSGLDTGVRAFPAYSASERSRHARIMSNPVGLSTSELSPVANYGTGLAPYFIALALWVGALLTYYLLRPLSGRALASPLPDRSVALSGYWPGALLVGAQALVLISVVRFGLGLDAVNPWALYGFAVLTALSFAAIIQWLVGTFGSVGKLLGIVFLMLQVTSAAGTFPIETAPAFFRAIHPLLPMTHVIIGLRQAISGGDTAALARAGLLVAAYGAAGFALTVLTIHRRRSWTMDRLRPSLTM